MKFETLENENIAALKTHNTMRRAVVSGLVGAVKKAAIDGRCQITEDLVDAVLLKELKSVNEMIDTCPASRGENLAEYQARKEIIEEFAPKLLTDETEIRNEIISLLEGIEISKKNRGQIMKTIMPAFKGRADMKVVNKVISEML